MNEINDIDFEQDQLERVNDAGLLNIADVCQRLVDLENEASTLENQLKDIIADLGENAKYNIQRFKGLGEMMPKQLWDTTMNPQTRMMKRVEIEDALEADRIFNILMGDKVAPRREFIETHSSNLDMATLDI